MSPRAIFVAAILLLSLALPSDQLPVEHNRVKRQAGNGQVINSIFQIPIQTLSAVSNLVQQSTPIIQQRIMRRINFAQSLFGSSPSAQQRPPRDGSSFKI